MGKALVLAPVDGQPDWYLVKDDLGVQYQVQSGVEGYPYAVGKEYRLFTPGGLYEPRFFRLLPYGTSRRWRSARATAKTDPATAAAMLLYNDKLITHQTQDRTATIESIQPYGADTTAILNKGGRAIIQPEDALAELYAPGDSIAVIHDPIPGVNGFCLKTKRPKHPVSPPTPTGWAAGTAVGPPKPHDPGCKDLSENWLGYSGAADLVNGGASEPPLPATPDVFIYRKTGATPLNFKSWSLYPASCHKQYAAVYGPLCAADANAALTLYAGTAELFPNSAEYANFTYTLPRPILMPPLYTGRTAVIAPPVVATAPVNRKLLCGTRELTMDISLTTADTHGHYTDIDGIGSGLMLPGCMILIFDKAPFPDYLGAANINADVMRDANGNGVYNSIYETNLDEPFKLVYARPDTADFSSLRVAVPGSTRAGHYALKRTLPRRNAANGIKPITATFTHNKFCVPMEDPETGFGTPGRLLARIFDADGTDVTAAAWYGDYIGGFFPGFFEMQQPFETVNLFRDFLAAYPFMANPAINPAGLFPRLAKIAFYAQGKIWFTPSGDIGGNPVSLECGGLRLYHQ